MRNKKSGFTLLEVVFTITLIVFLIGTVLLVYIAVLRGSYHMGSRVDLHEKLHFALERMVRDLRPANAVSAENNAITFTRRENDVDTNYRYYLYNPMDSWPPAYNQDAYDLKRAAVTGFTYGSGDLIAAGLKPPSHTTMSISEKVARIRLSAESGSDSLTISGYARPRNA